MNNLHDVHQLHVGGKPLDKSTRNVFVTGTMQDVQEQFQVGTFTIYHHTLLSYNMIILIYQSQCKNFFLRYYLNSVGCLYLCMCVCLFDCSHTVQPAAFKLWHTIPCMDIFESCLFHRVLDLFQHFFNISL